MNLRGYLNRSTSFINDSATNYEYLASSQIVAYVNNNYLDQTQDKIELATGNFHQDNLQYNNDLDCYDCPKGQPMKFIGNKVEIAKSRYQLTKLHYQAFNRYGCPVRGVGQKS